MQLLTLLSDLLVAGGSNVLVLCIIIFIGLIMIIIWLLKDRKRLIRTLGKRDDNMVEIIDKFDKSHSAAAVTMAGIRELLIELRALIGK